MFWLILPQPNDTLDYVVDSISINAVMVIVMDNMPFPLAFGSWRTGR